ncbi:MAG: hypothetical protein HYV14_03590 [Elusimicrobia bacterium]|nr:hypothetical protein [Elusimicrobiota bacterium]
MNRTIRTAALILMTAAGPAAGGTVKTKTPAQTVAAALSFTPPKGWTPVEYANAGGADPVVRYENLADAVQVRLFGAPGSDYPTPADFLAGPAASEQGAAPAAGGTALVAGKKLALHRRRFPIEPADPHRPSPGKSIMGTETFCVLPLKDGRFAVLAYRRASPIPDLQRKGEKAWEAFLKSVRPKAK